MTLGKLFGASAAVLAAIPGLVVVLTGLGAPPEKSLLFGAVIEATSAFTVILLWLQRVRIGRLSIKQVRSRAIRFASVGVLALGAYYVTLHGLLAEWSDATPVLVPPFPGPTADSMIAAAGSRDAALREYGSTSLARAVASGRGPMTEITIMILLMMLAGGASSSVASFALLGIRGGGTLGQ